MFLKNYCKAKSAYIITDSQPEIPIDEKEFKKSLIIIITLIIFLDILFIILFIVMWKNKSWNVISYTEISMPNYLIKMELNQFNPNLDKEYEYSDDLSDDDDNNEKEEKEEMISEKLKLYWGIINNNVELWLTTSLT
ncbi:hypothetical protein C1645_827475 [Glomus cerebriforme]|uniref:Uncharacterized protein n=1 Tax=Glomus cerebriforme TaxID=658196 RepID=A0A397SNW0_9GLOM|nr:hypothetical protein C1645_827475 [Glomus cerebriforme]